MPMIEFDANDPEQVRRALKKVREAGVKAVMASPEEGGTRTRKHGEDYGRVLPGPDGEMFVVAKASKFGVSLTLINDDELPVKKDYPEAEVLAIMTMLRGDKGIFVDLDANELRELGTSFIATASMMDEGKQALLDRFGD